jgi:methylmalonyl-CoA/ethylmalonyl-CoA epimerase
MDDKKNIPFDAAAIFQVGVLVKNIDETVKFYQEVFGIGPFEIFIADYPNATYYGEQAGYRGKRAFARMGKFMLELLEVMDGKSIHEDFLKEKGEGLHHIAFEVKDLRQAIKILESKGIKITQSFITEEGAGFAYLGSDKIGGAIFELIQWPKKKPEFARKIQDAVD